jgi:Zn-dependent protease with chaperone function
MLAFLLRWLLLPLFLIGMPLFIYLGFIRDEPILEVEYDVDLGRQSARAILEDPEEYPLLSPEEYPEAYDYLRRLVREVVENEEIQYADTFVYDSVKIINRDDVLNAFCAPGGFIYVYTGLIKYLDAEDHLAGVLGHEIAHAERRHSSLRLQKDFGRQAIVSFVALTSPFLGDVVAAEILRQLTSLSYSRGQEAEADAMSVRYLAGSDYACDGTAGFFEKLLREGDGVRIPEFLASHPDPESRVREIEALAAERGCQTELGDTARWREFQASLSPEPAAIDADEAATETTAAESGP